MLGGPPKKSSAFYNFQVPIYGLFSAKICCNMQWCTFENTVIGNAKQVET